MLGQPGKCLGMGVIEMEPDVVPVTDALFQIIPIQLGCTTAAIEAIAMDQAVVCHMLLLGYGND